ncbi:MAG: hypothetical protein NVSMB39_4120 [Candidatus Saccharimonadales bacterium]
MTSAGEASIVDLEGHVMGFLKASQTLVIVSGLSGDQDSQLRFILENLQPVKDIPNQNFENE